MGGRGIKSGLLQEFQEIIWIPINQCTYRKVSMDVYQKLLHLDLQFHVKRKTGHIMRILDRGLDSVEDMIKMLLFNVTPQILDIISSCIFLAQRIDSQISLVAVITLIIYVPATVYITERRVKVRSKMNRYENEKENLATDMLLNYDTMKFFGNENFEVSRYQNKLKNYQKAQKSQLFHVNSLAIAQSLIQFSGIGIGFVMCLTGIVRKVRTIGDIVMFLTVMAQLYTPLNYLSSYYRQLQKASIDMESMFELIDQKPKVQDKECAKHLNVKAGDIEFKNVNFGYDNGRSVLKDLSFKIPGGKSVAFVGPTGSGKSTILKIIMRLYDPNSGTVLIDGQNVSMVTQNSLRDLLTIVPQDSLLFNDSIEFNIRYGRLSASEKEIQQAAKLSQLHNIINQMPNKYQTIVGERGQRLSGGEKQRLSFARAILKQSPIMLLDEATSSLDQLTEYKIQQALRLLKGNQTTVMIAHRLSTVKDVDMIVVLKEGRIIETGTHNHLLRYQGLYYNLWNQQNVELYNMQQPYVPPSLQLKPRKSDYNSCFDTPIKSANKRSARIQQKYKQRGYGCNQYFVKARDIRLSNKKSKASEDLTSKLMLDLLQSQQRVLTTKSSPAKERSGILSSLHHDLSRFQNSKKQLGIEQQSKLLEKTASQMLMELLQKDSRLQNQPSLYSTQSVTSISNSEQDPQLSTNSSNSNDTPKDSHEAVVRNKQEKLQEKSAAELLQELVKSQKELQSQPSQNSVQTSQTLSTFSNQWESMSSGSFHQYYDNTGQAEQSHSDENDHGSLNCNEIEHENENENEHQISPFNLKEKKLKFINLNKNENENELNILSEIGYDNLNEGERLGLKSSYLLQDGARAQPQFPSTGEFTQDSICNLVNEQESQSSIGSNQDLEQSLNLLQENEQCIDHMADKEMDTYNLIKSYLVQQALSKVQRDAQNLQKTDQHDQIIYSGNQELQTFFEEWQFKNSSNG